MKALKAFCGKRKKINLIFISVQLSEIHETGRVKENFDFFAKYTCNYINASIRFSKFPNELKHADTVPAYKKK